MKKIILCAIIIASIFSCVKDESVGYVNEIPRYKVFTKYDGNKELNLVSGEIVEIGIDSLCELSNEGTYVPIEIDTNKFQFEWWLGHADYLDAWMKLLSKETVLKQALEERPGSFSTITLKVTDKTNDLSTFYPISINISNAVGNGLIVVDTKDESTSEFHEIQCMYTSERLDNFDHIVRKNLLKVMADQTYDGLVSKVLYSGHYRGAEGSNMFIAGTGGNLVLDGLYNVIHTDNRAWAITPDYVDVSYTQMYYGGSLIINNGKVHEYIKGKITHKLVLPSMEDYNISVVEGKSANASYRGYAYDEEKNRFLIIPFNHQNIYEISTGVEEYWDYNNVGNFDALYMGLCGASDYVATILKEEDSDHCYAYIFRGGRDNSSDKLPLNDNQRIVDLSNCPNISKATNFGTSQMQKVMYYIVGDKLYAVDLSKDNPTAHMVYQANSGENFTFMSIYNQYAYLRTYMNITGTEGYEKVRSGGRIIQLHTYNSATKEGKVIMLPIATLNNAEHGIESDVNCHKIIGGFGRILTSTFTTYGY